MNNKITLRWSDAWLLLAIYYAEQRGQSYITDIIATADYINHAIMNYEEVVSGLARLKIVNMINVKSDTNQFICSLDALAIIEPIIQRMKTAYEVKKEMESRLNIMPWDPKEPLPNLENNLEFDGITKEIYKSAVEEYLHRMKVKKWK